MSFAKVSLIGHLGKEVDLRYTPSGQAVGNFSVATTEGSKNKGGEWENITTWFKCTVWGKQAENCAKFLSKGSPIYLEGKLKEEKWDDKDGNERTSLVVNVTDVQFLSINKPEDNNEDSKKETRNKNDIPF